MITIKLDIVSAKDILSSALRSLCAHTYVYLRSLNAFQMSRTTDWFETSATLLHFTLQRPNDGIRQMKRRALFRALVLSAALLASVATGGCDSILSELSGAYSGPRPARENITSEVVIVRSINRQPGGVARLVLDRVRYSENGDPHDVNRVVQALTTQVQSAFDALNVQVSDRLVVSTSFIQVGETGDLREVPNWPGHNYPEYPIGVHYLTAVAKAAP